MLVNNFDFDDWQSTRVYLPLQYRLQTIYNSTTTPSFQSYCYSLYPSVSTQGPKQSPAIPMQQLQKLIFEVSKLIIKIHEVSKKLQKPK